MSASLNRVFLMGRLADEPELRHSGSGSSVCRFRLAVDDSYRNRTTGEMVERAIFIDIVLWGQQAESSYRWLRKGSPALVEGRLAADEWTDRDGRRRVQLRVAATSVQFIGPKPAEAGASPADAAAAPPSPPSPAARDLPF